MARTPCEGDGVCDGTGHCVHILAEVPSPQGIAVDADGVYWTGGGYTADGYVMRCGLLGCGGVPTMLATGQVVPQQIVADRGVLTWANSNLDGFGGGSIMACSTMGCMAAPLFVGPYAYNIAVDAANVYMTAQDTIRACARSGCGTTATLLASPSGHHWHAVVVGSVLLWTTATYPSEPGGLMRCDVDACVPTLVAPGPMSAGGLATDGRFAYWTDNVAGAVLRCPIDGCTAATTLVSGLTNPAAIATDGRDVYFTTVPMGPGGVFSCAADGCASPRTVAAGPLVFSPSSIAIDAASVYWTDFNTNLVVRAAR